MREKINKYALAAFAIPFLACVFICIGNGVYPFGDNCILHIDLYHQYCPFFTELMNKLKTGGNLMYSWNLGLGSDFVALYAYYMASPLNWLIILCPKNFVIEFMTILIILKIALAGLFFYLFLKKSFVTNERREMLAVVFGTAYALSGFMCAYSLDIMWLDGVALVPLVMLGLKAMVEEGKAVLYYVTLSLCIISNFYIAMMVCMFLVFYFVLLFIETKSSRIKAVFRFALYSLLAGGTGAFLLIPEARVLSYSGSSSMAFPKEMKWYFNIISELGRMCTTARVYSGDDHWPNLYSGAFAILLLILFILNRKISIKEKIPRILMVVFFLVSFSNNYLDFIWHGLHFPNSLPGRQSFLFTLTVLIIGYRELMAYRGTRLWHIVAGAVVSAGLLISGALLTDSAVTEELSFLVTGLFLICYIIVAVIYKLAPRRKKTLVVMLVSFIALVEVIINMAVTGFSITSRVYYVSKRDDYAQILEMAKDLSGGEFFRLEDTERMTKNDGALYGYPAATQFSSLMNINVSHFYQKVYMEGGKNFYGYNGATPLTTAMLSVDYFVSDTQMPEDELKTLVGNAGKLYLYRNNYVAPKGYMISETAVEDFEKYKVKKLSGLNRLASSLGAGRDMIYRADYDAVVQEGCTSINVHEDGYYYAAYKECDADQLAVESDDGRKTNYSKTTHRYLIDLGYYQAGSDIRITNSKSAEIEFDVYRLNMDSFLKAYDTLTAQPFTVTKWEDTLIEGKIDVKEAGRLVIPVANEEGWKLFVDGAQREIQYYADTFISTSLDEGEHEIRLEYKTPLLFESSCLSLGCLVIFIIITLIKKNKKEKMEN